MPRPIWSGEINAIQATSWTDARFGTAVTIVVFQHSADGLTLDFRNFTDKTARTEQALPGGPFKNTKSCLETPLQLTPTHDVLRCSSGLAWHTASTVAVQRRRVAMQAAARTPNTVG